MSPDPRLEATVDKVLGRTADEALAGLREAYEESSREISGAAPALEREYDRIVDEGRKEAEKVRRQLAGSSDLESRNRMLMLVEGAIDDVFERALARISGERGPGYPELLRSLLGEASRSLGTTEMVVSASAGDADAVRRLLPEFAGAELAPEPIECLGGVRARSRDGSTSFDNTIDARFGRMKPLFRKEIAARFGLGS